jgi:hypothetical protein
MKNIARAMLLILLFAMVPFRVVAEDTFVVSITELVQTEQGIFVTVSFNNSTDHKYSFGWAGSEAYITLSTDSYTDSIDMFSLKDKILIGSSSFSYLFRGVEGEPEEIIITGIIPLDVQGLPITIMKNGSYSYEMLDPFVFNASIPPDANSTNSDTGFGEAIARDGSGIIYRILPSFISVMWVIVPSLALCIIIFRAYIFIVNNRLKQKSAAVIDDANKESVEALIIELLRAKFSFAWQANTRQVLHNAYGSAHYSPLVSETQKDELRKLCYKKGVMGTINASARNDVSSVEAIYLDPDKMGRVAIKIQLMEEAQNLNDLVVNAASGEFDKNVLRAFAIGCRAFVACYINSYLRNRVGGRSLIGRPTSHTTVRTVRYTAVR